MNKNILQLYHKLVQVIIFVDTYHLITKGL